MTKHYRNIIIALFLLFVVGYMGARYDDPIEQLGILAMLASGILIVYLALIMTKTEADRFIAAFTIMASLTGVATVCRIIRFPFVPFFLTLICMLGFIGIFLHRILHVSRKQIIDKEDVFIVLSSFILLFFLTLYAANTGLIISHPIKIVAYLLVSVSGLFLLSTGRVQKVNFAVILTLVIAASIKAVSLIEHDFFRLMH